MKRYKETRAWIKENTKCEMWERAPYNAVRLTATWKGQEYYGLGFAKLRPGDEWDDMLGGDIACGRAELDLARQLPPGWAR
jgi:hypothetical protein